MLIFDTETTIDTSQRLTFGGYRFCQWRQGGSGLICKEEGFFYADDLPERDPEGFERLKAYVEQHRADVARGVPDRIRLLSRTEFVNTVLWRIAYEAQGLVVGFNLPFDLSRLAVKWGKARGQFLGGISLELWRWQRKNKKRSRANPFRPRIVIQHVDSKRSFIQFTGTMRKGQEDAYSFRGHFLDLRTFTFALTDKGHTLDSACQAFGVEHGKTQAAGHGEITPDYIAYNRRDVLATQELLEKLREEFDRHPINLDPCAAYSPASIAKAYYRAMGLCPPLDQFRKIRREVHGRAMAAFYGGRAEVRIRKAIVPVVHTDFTSMYPTVQCLMELWERLTAEKIEVEDATADVRRFLERVTLEDCFDPTTWKKQLVGFAEIVPQDDVLPVRAKYDGNEWNVGVNHLTSDAPLWYAIPDLVMSKLLTGKPPQIRRAFRLAPKGRQRLTPLQLRGRVPVDPRRENLFRSVIEERQRVRSDESLSPEERESTQRFLKTLANAGSYGVFVEMNRKQNPREKPDELRVYGLGRPLTAKTTAPEDPGPFCFPPVGALITSAARLMLAMLERCVTDLGGSYVFADTDSMAIVASRSGGLIACKGGSHRLRGGKSAIRALSWAEVDAIVARFEGLNPYDREEVPGSILRIEDVNRCEKTGKQREILAYAISAKRYALFAIGKDGRPEILPDGYSEHGLGQYLNPTDPECEDRDWIRQVWEGVVSEALGRPLPEPSWASTPAMMKTAVTTPLLLDRFKRVNRGKTYVNRVKPFNFLLSASVDPIDYPPLTGKAKGFHLVSPYSSRSAGWLRFLWEDVHTGKQYRVCTRKPSTLTAVRVQQFADVLCRFRDHPEAKSADSCGKPAGKRTYGLLGRRHVRVLTIRLIGKETNLLEQQEEGVLIMDPQAVYPCSSEWELLRRHLKKIDLKALAELSGIDERRLREYRQGPQAPKRTRIEKIAEALAGLLDG